MAAAADPANACLAELVVTLVHGTHATNAPWMKEDSTLSTTLRQRLGPGLKLVAFNWTGHNASRARLAAASDLAGQLARQVNDYPQARHYVVSHSHGGAVALRAAAESGVLDRIAGVVCMATPFLVARERDLGRLGGRTETIVGIILAIAFGGPPLLDILLAPFQWPDTLRFVVKGTVLLAIVTATMLAVLAWQKRAQRLLQDLSFEPIDSTKVLIVRTPADEASGFLIMGQLISQLTVRVYLGAQRLVARAEATAARWSHHRWILAGVAAALVVVEFLLLIAYAEATSRGLAPWIATLALTGIYVTVFLVIFGIVLLVPVVGVQSATVPVRILVSVLTWPTIAILSLVLVLPFGWEVALANILLDVTAETTPAGSWMVHLFPAPTAQELGRDVVPLMHSIVYENPRALDFIAGWIAPDASPAPESAAASLPIG